MGFLQTLECITILLIPVTTRGIYCSTKNGDSILRLGCSYGSDSIYFLNSTITIINLFEILNCTSTDPPNSMILDVYRV